MVAFFPAQLFHELGFQLYSAAFLEGYEVSEGSFHLVLHVLYVLEYEGSDS